MEAAKIGVEEFSEHQTKEAVLETKLELREMLGNEVKVDLSLDRVRPEKNEYTISAKIRGLSRFIHISKTGQGLHESLYKIKKAIVRQVRSLLDKQRSVQRRRRL